MCDYDNSEHFVLSMLTIPNFALGYPNHLLVFNFKQKYLCLCDTFFGIIENSILVTESYFIDLESIWQTCGVSLLLQENIWRRERLHESYLFLSSILSSVAEKIKTLNVHIFWLWRWESIVNFQRSFMKIFGFQDMQIDK